MAHINEPSIDKKKPLLVERDRAAAELREAVAHLEEEAKAFESLEQEARKVLMNSGDPATPPVR